MNLTNNEKRYNTLNNYLRYKYGKKVFKVALNADFTCPNKTGESGYGGCTFCSPTGSGDFAGNKVDSLKDQFENRKAMMHEKWPDALYIVYFQAGTNTYKDVETLKKLYYEALNLHPNIVGLSIATRPDALDDDIYDLLEEISHKTNLWIELGLQTIHEETSTLINRGHDLDCFTNAVEELRKRNLYTIVHIINGLPYETKEMMFDTINYVNTLDIQGIKIHLLHIMKQTKMGNDYLKNPFELLTLEQYTSIVATQIKMLNPNFIIHRLTGDAPKHTLIAPLWSLKKFVVMNEIDKELRKQNAYQGDLYKKNEL